MLFIGKEGTNTAAAWGVLKSYSKQKAWVYFCITIYRRPKWSLYIKKICAHFLQFCTNLPASFPKFLFNTFMTNPNHNWTKTPETIHEDVKKKKKGTVSKHSHTSSFSDKMALQWCKAVKYICTSLHVWETLLCFSFIYFSCQKKKAMNSTQFHQVDEQPQSGLSM